MTVSTTRLNDVAFDLESVESGNGGKGRNAIVLSSGELSFDFLLPTTKLLNLLTSLSTSYQQMDAGQQKRTRKKLYDKIYIQCRPDCYIEIHDGLHARYAGQPGGHDSDYYWRVFCDERFKNRIESLVGDSVVKSPTG